MVRPQSSHRAPHLTMEVLRQAWHRYRQSIEIVIFGVQADVPALADMPSDFPCKVAGVLAPEATARLLNEADIFVDFSTYQAMGLTALEAMCCGVATIVPAKGGADSYARPGVNSLSVDTSSPEACLSALRHLIEDHSLRAQMQRHAIVDAARMYPERTAFNILSALFPG
jgi:glycosyltransferase involved in cell wall biosynthesis